MIKRHGDQLLVRLDELYVKRTTFISWDEIRHWYNIQRIAKAPWRDIDARWRELLEEKEVPYVDPQVVEVSGGWVFLFFNHRASLSSLAA